MGKNQTQCWAIWQYMKVLDVKGLLPGLQTIDLETLVQVRHYSKAGCCVMMYNIDLGKGQDRQDIA